MAAHHLRRERDGHTLEPTALVHEVYLRLVDQRSAQWGVLPGQDATLDGSTDLAPDQIDRLQLESLDGTVLLEAQIASGRDG